MSQVRLVSWWASSTSRNFHFLLLLQQLDKRRQSLTGSKVKQLWSSCSLSFYPSRHTPGQLPSMHEFMSFPKQTC